MSRIGRLALALVIFMSAFLVLDVLYRLLFGMPPTLWVTIGLNVATVFAVFFLGSRFNTWRAKSLIARQRPQG